MARTHYDKGLADIGNGLYAYMQPDGGWGWSNAGLIADQGDTMLVDTLFDLKLTDEMLATMRRAVPAAAKIKTLVNTHANGDHCWGNQCVECAEIVASRACAEELQGDSTARIEALMRAPGRLGDYVRKIFGPFDFSGIQVTAPTRTFERELTLSVGGKRVDLIEVGPCHTKGDILVHVPDDKVVFTGDILFIEGHPILWVGPVQNWIDACDRMLAMDLDVVVPGHGPLTNKAGIRAVKGYLEYVTAEARKRYDAGMPVADAARDIVMDDYSSWGDGERIAVNVTTLYREFAGDDRPADILATFELMAELAR